MILDLALIIPAVIVGALAHEAMHYLSVWPVAENVRVVRPSSTRLAVEYDYYHQLHPPLSHYHLLAEHSRRRHPDHRLA